MRAARQLCRAIIQTSSFSHRKCPKLLRRLTLRYLTLSSPSSHLKLKATDSKAIEGDNLRPTENADLQKPLFADSKMEAPREGIFHRDSQVPQLDNTKDGEEQSCWTNDGHSSKDQMYVLAVDATLEALLEQEDLNKDGLITVDDRGPKSFTPKTSRSGPNEDLIVKGNYSLAVLLQELFFAKQRGDKHLEIRLSQLTEDPVQRLEKFIKSRWWDTLTRQMGVDGIATAAPDPKAADSQPRIYVPAESPEQYAYYAKIAAEKPEMRLEVQRLPEGEIDPEFIKSLNIKPGILSLAMEEDPATKELKALPFIVPGGRFNELYNWDTVFGAGWGMIETHPYIVKSTIRHFAFEIQHYGKTLNANRSYYLGRAQPPFLTTLALRVYDAMKSEPDAKDRLKEAILAAMKEYHSWWMSPPRYDEVSGLTRYRPIGSGFPPECEATQFDHILAPFAEKHRMDIPTVTQAYNDGKIFEPELDLFCLHDRAVRESGHDVSRRTEGVCADLGTVDLNCLLYKYETDIEYAIRTVFDDRLQVPAAFCAPGQEADRVESSALWESAATKRKHLIDKYLWNEDKGFYFDYNTRTQQQTDFESVTTFWALWSGVANPEQAALVVEKGLPKFECIGGLSVGTEKSRGPLDAAHPQMQWDFPYGWPPHQILAWDGLKRYGYDKEAERLVYRWLHMITNVFVNFNGTVVEKYDVTQLERPHQVYAEYGNQGLNFKYAPQEGFAWTNGSIIHGLSILDEPAKRALGALTSYEDYANALKGA